VIKAAITAEKNFITRVKAAIIAGKKNYAMMAAFVTQ
jgi:hypothetical protein